jgi:phosphoribosylformylglycinamidine synthase subunit PurSL
MIHRVDVWTLPQLQSDRSPEAGLRAAIKADFADPNTDPGAVHTTRVFLLDAPELSQEQQAQVLALLSDPIAESATFHKPTNAVAQRQGSLIEVHLKPGVMDPVAASTLKALQSIGIHASEVRTGRTFRFANRLPDDVLKQIAKSHLANGVIEQVVLEQFVPDQFAVAPQADNTLRHVKLTTLNDEELKTLSRTGHLFLSLDEMKAVQAQFKKIGREPTDIELETLAQTWSEHCVHKTLKSAVEVIDASGKTLRSYKNLIKETIFFATQELMRRQKESGKPALCLSVFKDNAGVIAFDDDDAVCIKVETHNRPSAIEPYGGAATGAGGCIRDVLGTGLGARPIANTDIFCVAPPDTKDLPKSVIHPKRTLTQVVAGVRDYGNRMGIPTVNGAVYFDPNYVANPLVFCGCVGLLPMDKIFKEAKAGDAVVVMGGRTGRDGIHGATFSSAELTTGHADEFSHAVQIGNAITQKRMMDVLLAARDQGLYTAVTDCGAGGLSSAVGEMGADLGAEVDLETVPLKYAGLRYDEIWISEAQERMVLSVPQDCVNKLLELAKSEDVEATVIGTFGTKDAELILRFKGNEVGRMSMAFVHDGIPMPTRKAVVGETNQTPSHTHSQTHSLTVGAIRGTGGTGIPPVLTEGQSLQSARGFADTGGTPVPPANVVEHLLGLLSHPNIASKHWIVRQYDHEVRGGTVIKPLVGPNEGPGDATVLRPKPTHYKGVVLSNGFVPAIADPYAMAVASIDEAVRNAICIGATLSTLAILDNFCWPGVHDEVSMGTLVRACEGCRDASLAFGIPFISGKDSLHNQFTDTQTGKVIKIPPTLLISAMGTVQDVRKSVTMDFKQAGSAIVRVQPTSKDFASLLASHKFVEGLIRTGQVRSAHDVSDGGWLTAVAEMCIASNLGATITAKLDDAFVDHAQGALASYILEVADASIVQQAGAVRVDVLGTTLPEPTLVVDGQRVGVDSLHRAWHDTLDW